MIKFQDSLSFKEIEFNRINALKISFACINKTKADQEI